MAQFYDFNNRIFVYLYKKESERPCDLSLSYHCRSFHRAVKGNADGGVNAGEHFGGELFHTVIGKNAVDLVLYIGKLGLDGGRKPLAKDRGDDLLHIQPLVRGGKRLGALKALIAEGARAEVVPLDRVGISAELGQRQNAAAVVFRPCGAEVDVPAAQIAAALILPSAGVIVKPRGVARPERLGHADGIKLPPALVEGGVKAERHAVVKRVLQFLSLPHILLA